MYVVYQALSGTIGKVTQIIFNPTQDDKTAPGRLVEGDVLPEVKGPVGFVPALMIDLTTNKLYYDYSSPDSTDSRVQMLRSEVTMLQRVVDDLILWGV